jgi:hypothetical protein
MLYLVKTFTFFTMIFLFGCDGQKESDSGKAGTKSTESATQDRDASESPVEKAEQKNPIATKSADEVRVSLMDLGWERKYDDFEDKENFQKNGGTSFSCKEGTIYASIGLAEPLNNAFYSTTIALLFFGHEELVRPNALQWKTPVGRESIALECTQDLDRKWNETCLFKIGTEQAKTLSQTDFIRVDASSVNLDFKGNDQKCDSFFNGIKTLAGDFAVSNS